MGYPRPLGRPACLCSVYFYSPSNSLASISTTGFTFGFGFSIRVYMWVGVP